MAWWIIGTDHLKGKIMGDRKVLNRTHFTRRMHSDGWQWYWDTRANNGKKTAVGGEGYNELRGAVNGFFSTHGIQEHDLAVANMGENGIGNFSKLEKFADDHYVITQYEDVQSDVTNS